MLALDTARAQARVVLGCGSLSSRDRPRSYVALDRYFEAGGRIFDTARVYGSGSSEQTLGAWLADRGVRAAVHVVTKGGHPDTQWRSRLGREEVEADARASQRALGLSQVDTFLLHRDDPLCPVSEIAATLTALVDAGIARRIGVSNWTAPRVARLADALAHAGGPRLAVVSNAFGLATLREPTPLPGLERVTPALLRVARERDIMILAWGALSSGFFAGLAGTSTAQYQTPRNRVRCDVLTALAKAASVDPLALLTRWLVTRSSVMTPIMGTLDPTRIAIICAAAMDMRLDPVVDDLSRQIEKSEEEDGSETE